MKRAGRYAVPFEVAELSYEEAVAIAADTGTISGDAGPLLETVIDMLDEAGRPDEHLDCIQVAGTNGKTSTTRFCAALLRAEGKRCALYTSPQLVRYEERMEIDGAVVAPELFSHGVSAALEAGRRVNEHRGERGEPLYTITPFDLLTVAALIVFAEQGVEVAVLEVGMGGHWDATSATDPAAVAITGIGLDHTRILGDTLAAIAGEKAAVIKPGRAVVLGEGVHDPEVWDVIAGRCAACGVEPVVVSHELVRLPDALGDPVVFSTSTPLAAYEIAMCKPAYQPQNAACAIALAEAYLDRPLDAARAAAALDACPVPGRFDVVRRDPFVLVDACHNPQSCEHFVDALSQVAPRLDDRPCLLVAALADKDVAGILDVLVPAFPRIVVSATSSERALPASELASMVSDRLGALGRSAADVVAVYPAVPEAVRALTEAARPFVAAGTITLAGEVAGLLRRP